MDFCSKYGYDYGFEGSDEEDCEIDDNTKQIKTKIRKADTNIIAVTFDQLVAANEMFAGEPKKCNNCGAFMSFISAQNVQKVDDKFMWKCEFCEQTNGMSGVLEDVNEIPKEGDVTFLLEAAKGKAQSASASASNEANNTDNAYLTFCMDVSGSMDGWIPIKEEDKDANKNHVFKRITRLEGVKIACLETLNKLKDNEPEKQVSLVTFSDAVKFYGDCTKVRNNRPLVELHQGDELTNKEKVQSKAFNTDSDIKGIEQTHAGIEQRIKNLRTEGSTALGPALFYSIVFSSKKPGSSIILCTDGCANVGLGSIENANIAQGEKYYDEIADFAKEQGVVVNVLSMEGTDCKLNVLGRVTERSNGVLNIVNPLNLSEEFKSILENRLVATNVQAKLIVNHKYLYIRDEKLEEEEAKARENNDEQARIEVEKKRQSIIVKDIGNANIDTEVTFEYGIRKLENKEQRPDSLDELPFQLQITYTATDGSKAVRVYTKVQKFTRNRNEAERHLSSRDLLFMHKAQATTYHMLSKNAVASKMKNSAYENMYHRNYWQKADYEDMHYQKIQNSKLAFCMDECNDMDSKAYYYENKLSRMKLEKQRMLEEERRRDREREFMKKLFDEEKKKKEQQTKLATNLIVDDSSDESSDSSEGEEKKKEEEKRKKAEEEKKKEEEEKRKKEEEDILRNFTAAMNPAADVDKKDDQKKDDENK